jgi:ParB family chromosome partitioning protein
MADTRTPEGQSVEFLDVDPTTLVIGPNIRTDPLGEDRALAGSIRARGVLEVITAYRDADANLVVYRGQRRTLIAAQVGTPTGRVPVRVIDEPSEEDRIVDQMSENLHRANMNPREVRDGIEQLSLAGLSPATIAKRLATKRAAVDAALTVVGSQSARDLMDGHGLTLEQAAALTQFEDDAEATSQLLGALERGYSIDHQLQQLRDARTEAKALTAEQDRWRAEGYPVIDRPDREWSVRLENLRDVQGEPFDPDTYPSVVGAAVFLEQDWVYPDDDGQDEAEDADPVAEWTAVWVCVDPQAHGYTSRHGSRPSGDAQAEKTEAEKAQAANERRTVIANNNAWRSAQIVRRTWLASFVTRRTPPKGAESIVAQAMLTGPAWLNRAMDVNRHSLRRQLIAGEKAAATSGSRDCQALAEQSASETPKRAIMLALAAVLAAWEDQADEQTWRNPDSWDARIVSALQE